MHYAYCARRPQAYTELIGCMRKGLPFAGEIIGAARHEEPKPTATAITPPSSKRFKLSLPVDQRKRPFPSPLPLPLLFPPRIDDRSRTSDLRATMGRARNDPLSGLNNDSALDFGSEVWEITPLRLIAPRVRKQYRERRLCTLLRMQIARYARISSSLSFLVKTRSPRRLSNQKIFHRLLGIYCF